MAWAVELVGAESVSEITSLESHSPAAQGLPNTQNAMNPNSSFARLKRITDWPKRAADASYQVARVARSCNVTVKTLERFFEATKDVTPKQWMLRLRLEKADALVANGMSVKAIAYSLKYTQVSNFSRDFKRFHAGRTPATARKYLSASGAM